MATTSCADGATLAPAGIALRIGRLIRWLEGWPAGLVLLGARLWMASIFFRSGLLKIQNFASAQFLFAEVHPVPFLPPGLAAGLATGFELVCPVLLALGLLTRLAALPLLAMALVIQFVVGAADPAFWQTEHDYWMLLLGVLITKGAGRLSLDALLARRSGVGL
jgi:putative oxidoreductase